MVTAKQLSLLDLAAEQRPATALPPSATSTEHAEPHPYLQILERLGISAAAMPDPEDKQAVLKAMLDGIGEDDQQLASILNGTNITIRELLAAGSSAERRRFYKALARKLERELAYCTGTEQWYRHPGFWRYPILLTDGVMHVAEHGGMHTGTAFWLVDAIASYQGEKVLARHPFQVWKLTVTETEDQPRHARLVCTNGNHAKPIIEQVIESTDFLLDEITLYASVEAVDASSQKKQVILLLPSEY